MKLNKVYNEDCIKTMARMPDESVQLIISDPPYYRVKGAFDFAWATFDDYLKDVEKWAREFTRILAENGSLYIYGHAKRIAYIQVIFDKYLNLENSLVWEQYNRQTIKGYNCMRCYMPTTDRILFDSKEVSQTGLERIKLDTENFKPLRDYFRAFQEDTGLTKKAIIDRIGQRADHCFRWGSTQWDLPTEETYADLLSLPKNNGFLRREYEELRREYEELRREYEELRREYEELRRPFNNKYRLTDVLRFGQESHVTGKYDHETIKPEKLTAALIETATTAESLVYIPFAGSGTECKMCKALNRSFIASEINADYVNLSNIRLKNYEAAEIDNNVGLFAQNPAK